MKNLFFNLQLFAEGGGGAEGSSAGEASGSNIGALEGRNGRGDSSPDVVYGKQPEELTADSEDGNSKPSKISFDELIKGEYKEDFEKRTQSIINKRFKESKNMEETLRSHDPILNMLADKYGVDVKDIASLTKAIEDDESFYEQEAMDRGLTVKQLKELKTLERENRAFREAQEQAQRRENSDRIYAQWTKEAETLKERYGLTNFSLEEEVQNPDFVKLLSNGISLESAYKAIHMDDMLSGAMAKTAETVREKMSNSIQSRQSRPAENGITNTASRTFKTDVNSLSKADRDKIDKLVMRGEIISF